MDIRVVQSFQFPQVVVPLDWLILVPEYELDSTHELESAIITMLGTDRLAEASDVLPQPTSIDRRGWWGDLDAEEIWGAWPVGWRGWLLTRTKITDIGAKQGATVTLVRDYLTEGLTPFVKARLITSFGLDVQRNTSNRQRIDAQVTLFRGNNSPLIMLFQFIWGYLGLQVVRVT